MLKNRPVRPGSLFAPLCGGVLAVVASSCSMSTYQFNATKSMSATYEGTITKLTVATRVGDISIIEDASVEHLTVDAKITATGATQVDADARLKKADVLFKRRGVGSIEVVPSFPPPPHGNEGANLMIRMPSLKSITIKAESSTGDIKVTGANGSIDLDTSTGDIMLVDSSGEAALDASVGTILVRGHNGPLKVDARTGDIRVDDHTGGSVDADCSTGDIIISLADGATVSVDADASLGDVKLEIPNGFNGPIEVDSSVGGVTIEDPGKRVTSREITEGEGRIQIGTGGTGSELETGLGSISITIRGNPDAKATEQPKKKGPTPVS